MFEKEGVKGESVDGDAEDVQDPVEFVVRAETDLDRSAAGAITEADAGGEPIAEAIFDIHHMGVAGGDDGGRG